MEGYHGTTLNVACPVCGDAELLPQQVRVVICNEIERSYYAFICPRCHDEVRKPADGEVMILLVLHGAQSETWEIPAEALELRPVGSRDDLLNDLLEFMGPPWKLEVARGALRTQVRG